MVCNVPISRDEVDIEELQPSVLQFNSLKASSFMTVESESQIRKSLNLQRVAGQLQRFDPELQRPQLFSNPAPHTSHYFSIHFKFSMPEHTNEENGQCLLLSQ